MPEETKTQAVVGDETQKPSPEQVADAQMDKWLEDHDVSGEPSEAMEGEKPTEGQPRDEQGRFTAQSQESKEAVEPTEAVNPEEHAKALKALKLDKVPEEVIDSMSPQKIIDWGLMRAENHADVDRIKTRAAELEKAAKEREPEPEEHTEPNWDNLTTEFVEVFGEDSKGPLKKFGQSLLEFVRSEIGSGQAESLALEKVRRIEQEAAIQALSTKRPLWNLDDASRQQKLLDHRSADKNEYDSELEALEVAGKILFSDDANATEAAQRAEQHRARDNGQTTVESQRPAPTEPTLEDLETQLLNAIQDGDEEKKEEIGRQLGRRSELSLTEALSTQIGVPKRR